MCKNADNPCPGCKKHKNADAKFMFFTDEEVHALEEGRRRTGPAPAISGGSPGSC